MSHSKLTKLLAVVLAALTLAAPATASISASSGTSTSTKATNTTSSQSALTDLLKASSYSDYLEKYASVDMATETVTIKGDDIIAYAEELTDAYADVFLTDSKGNEMLDENGNKIKKYVTTASDIKTEGQITIVQTLDGVKCLYLPADGTVGWNFVAPQTGKYAIDIKYYPNDGTTGEAAKTTGIERTLFLNGKVPFYEARFLTLSKVWNDDESSYQLDDNGNVVYTTDASGNKVPQFKQDINGNEIKADKVQSPEWRTYQLKDSTGYFINPLLFYITKGNSTIAFQAQREAMFISEISIHPETKLDSYEEYISKYVALGATDATGSAVKIQAEYALATSENTIYATNDRTSYITEPQDSAKIYMNALGGDGGEKWQSVGQWVRYSIQVEESGFYDIVLRFKQSVLQGTFSSRTFRVKLPGQDYATVPFEEANYLQFNYDDEWQTAALNDGDTTFKIYLEKGVNEIEFEASFGNMVDILRRVSQSLTTINAIYIKLLKITGATPDNNRDYGFYDIMPNDIDELAVQAKELFAIAEQFKTETNTSGSHVATLETVARLLERMSEESKIASNMTNLKSNLGTLGTWLQESMDQPLELDYIQIQAPGSKLPKANHNFLQSIWFEIKQFIQSFFADYNTLGATEKVDDDDIIEVWTTLGRDQAQIIRNLITNGFNSKHEDSSVVLKLVAGGSLIPSVLANVGPDVSLGHGSGDVINWAIRSAVVGLDQMEGYDEVASWFTKAAMVPLTLQELYETKDVSKSEYENAYVMSEADYAAYKAKGKTTQSLAQYGYEVAGQNGKKGVVYTDPQDGKEYYFTKTVYGLPETQSFSMMFYRADILLDLGITPPKTWDELIAIIPELQRNHMEIAFPTSLGGLQTFLYQMGGELYADDGRRIGLDTDIALSAFEYLCQFFQQYRFPISYDFANRFRSGEIPIGIVDYTAYTQLSVYATEIKGLWEFVQLPAFEVVDEDGNVTYSNNSSVSGVSSIIMLADEKRTEEKTKAAWEFMKWYVSADNQASYADELTALLGSVSKHNTANVQALESLPWTTNEKNNLMAQFENLSAVPEYPGSYIIGRYVGFAFLAVYNSNAKAEDSILEYVVEINKELSRKRQEFGMAYYDISYSTSFVESKD